MRVGIAGAGGIGSNVAFQLVRSGVHSLKIVDFDHIEASNLNRQFYFAHQLGQAKAPALVDNLRRIDPQVQAQALVLRLGAENMTTVFSDVDVVVEGFDGAEDKKTLLESFAGSRKLVVAASGVAGLELNTITHRKLGNCHIVGDFGTQAGRDNLYAPKVLMVSCIMSQIVLKHYLALSK